MEVSYFEIYNEKIHDLLSVQQAIAGTAPDTPVQRQALKVREHPIFGPYVVDLSAHSVDSYSALRNWLAVGNSQRATASTAMNDKSSRSHSIFNIVLNLTDLSSDDGMSSSTDTDSGTVASLRQTRRSKISLVDLAGSERISVSGSNGERIREGVSINKSLLTLGKVIAALADSHKTGGGGAATPSAFVPYRESVLTWLLRVSERNTRVAIEISKHSYLHSYHTSLWGYHVLVYLALSLAGLTNRFYYIYDLFKQFIHLHLSIIDKHTAKTVYC